MAPYRAGRASWRTLFKILLAIGVLVGLNLLSGSILGLLDFEIRPLNEDAIHRTLMIAAFSYAVLLAVPFVPGAEIGLAMLATFGPPIVFLVYVCTVAGLTMSFMVGRYIPSASLIRLAAELNLNRLAALLARIDELDAAQRLEYLIGNAPNRLLPFLLRHRHAALALIVNVPGNFLIGGGGGIALFAGISRLYSAPAFVVTIMIAVAPVPVAVLLFGKSFLAP